MTLDPDDPALVMPKVMDVDGTLTRLGFKGHTTLKDGQFYLLTVPLFGGGVKSGYVGRKISHARFCVRVDYEMHTVNVMTSYGYPYNLMKKNKILAGFRTMTGEISYITVYLSKDSMLIAVETMFKQLSRFLITCRINPADFVKNGKELPPHAALAKTVQAALSKLESYVPHKKASFVQADDGVYWDAPAEADSKKREIRKQRLNDFNRQRHMFRHAVRPR